MYSAASSATRTNCPTVQQIIRADNFYFDAHQKIFQAICELADEHQPLDLVMLHERLKKNKQLEDVGGVMYLTELWESVPTGANAEYHAKIVRDTAMVAEPDPRRHRNPPRCLRPHAIGRRTRVAGRAEDHGHRQGRDGRRDADAEPGGPGGVHADRLAASARTTSQSAAWRPGYVDLDNLLAGLQNSELVIIAARPSVGKTAIALNIVRNIITGHDPDSGERSPVVLFVSLEMSRIELAERLLCCQSRVDSHKVRKGHLNSDDIQKLMDAGDVLRKARLYLDDTPSRSMIQIAATARRIQKKHEKDGGLRLVVIDYLQLIDPENRRDPRQEQVAQISRRLKFLARELNIPVIALAQVNRASEDRQDHKPRLADLRESGSIEQDADTCLMLHRPGRFDGDAGRQCPGSDRRQAA